jgi:CheY-like chemotaxis protein
MEGMTGLDVLERLRTDARLSRIPVIILTGADLTAEQKEKLSNFGHQMILKSVLKEQDLLNELEQALKQFMNNGRK